MAISIKTSKDIEKMRVAGNLAAKILELIEPYIQPGISTGEIDRLCNEFITIKYQAVSACLGYHGFPKSVCISINDVVCHGIPNNKIVLKEGDIVNIDVAIIKDKFYSDTSKMFLVGKTTTQSKRLCQIAQNSLYLAIQTIYPGTKLCKIGKVIQKYVESQKFSVVREYCGHGIGKMFHEEPQILHCSAKDNGIIIREGMTFTIEPMINAGSNLVYSLDDGWTVKTKDHSLSAQYEHTIAVTKSGCEILTLRDDDKIDRFTNL